MIKDYEERSYYDIQLTKKQIIVFLMAQLAILSLAFFLGVMVGKSSKEAAVIHPIISEKTPIPESPPKEIKTMEEAKLPTPKKEFEFYSLKEPSQSKIKKEEEKPSIISPSQEKKPESIKTENYYALQLYALREKASAEEKEKKLKDKGYTVSVILSKGLYKIRIGKFATKEEALKFKEAFEKKEKITPTMIVPY